MRRSTPAPSQPTPSCTTTRGPALIPISAVDPRLHLFTAAVLDPTFQSASPPASPPSAHTAPAPSRSSPPRRRRTGLRRRAAAAALSESCRADGRGVWLGTRALLGRKSAISERDRAISERDRDRYEIAISRCKIARFRCEIARFRAGWELGPQNRTRSALADCARALFRARARLRMRAVPARTHTLVASPESFALPPRRRRAPRRPGQARAGQARADTSPADA